MEAEWYLCKVLLARGATKSGGFVSGGAVVSADGDESGPWAL